MKTKLVNKPHNIWVLFNLQMENPSVPYAFETRKLARIYKYGTKNKWVGPVKYVIDNNINLPVSSLFNL